MILLDGATLSLDHLLAIADDCAEVGLAPEARARVAASRAVVDAKAAGSEPVYGVTSAAIEGEIFTFSRVQAITSACSQTTFIKRGIPREKR